MISVLHFWGVYILLSAQHGRLARFEQKNNEDYIIWIMMKLKS